MGHAVRSLAMGAILAATGAVSASATELPATFLADQSAIKKNLVAGDNVTATLYSDSSCSVAISGGSQVIAIESVDVIEATKPLKIKGATVKPPKGASMHFVFSLASAPAGDVFLQVTSAKAGAIVGIPTDCQPQGGRASETTVIATGVLAYGVLAGGIGNGTIYTFSHPGTGVYHITFPGIHLTTAPHPLLVTGNLYPTFSPPLIAENFISLDPLVWTVRTYSSAGVLEDHDFSFALLPGGY